MNTDELVTVPVLVPRSRVADIQAFAAELNRQDLVGMESTPRVAARAVGLASNTTLAGHVSWREGDGALAEKVLRASRSTNTINVIKALVTSREDSPLSAAELNDRIGLDGRRRNGVLSKLGQSCRRRGREGPWHWGGRDNNVYWMDDTQADLFSKALAELNRL